MTATDTLTLEVTLTNSGTRAGDEVVQVYVQRADSPDGKHTELAAFTREHDLHPHESRRVRFELPARAFSRVDADGQRIIEHAAFTVSVGGFQPNHAPHPHAVVTGALTVEGR
jgi:beta-glucosidase